MQKQYHSQSAKKIAEHHNLLTGQKGKTTTAATWISCEVVGQRQQLHFGNQV
jgi:hypothetical protein